MLIYLYVIKLFKKQENGKSKIQDDGRNTQVASGVVVIFSLCCFIIYRFATYYLVFIKYYIYYEYDVIEPDKYSDRNCYLYG